MRVHLVAVVEAVAVRVGIERVGAVAVHLIAVGKPVIVAVGVEGIGAEPALVAVVETVPVGVGIPRVGAELDLLHIGETVAVEVVVVGRTFRGLTHIVGVGAGGGACAIPRGIDLAVLGGLTGQSGEDLDAAGAAAAAHVDPTAGAAASRTVVDVAGAAAATAARRDGSTVHRGHRLHDDRATSTTARGRIVAPARGVASRLAVCADVATARDRGRAHEHHAAAVSSVESQVVVALGGATAAAEDQALARVDVDLGTAVAAHFPVADASGPREATLAADCRRAAAAAAGVVAEAAAATIEHVAAASVLRVRRGGVVGLPHPSKPLTTLGAVGERNVHPRTVVAAGAVLEDAAAKAPRRCVRLAANIHSSLREEGQHATGASVPRGGLQDSVRPHGDAVILRDRDRLRARGERADERTVQRERGAARLRDASELEATGRLGRHVDCRLIAARGGPGHALTAREHDQRAGSEARGIGHLNRRGVGRDILGERGVGVHHHGLVVHDEIAVVTITSAVPILPCQRSRRKKERQDQGKRAHWDLTLQVHTSCSVPQTRHQDRRPRVLTWGTRFGQVLSNWRPLR